MRTPYEVALEGIVSVSDNWLRYAMLKSIQTLTVINKVKIS